MLSSLHLEYVAERFQPFVDELRSFCKQSDVAYGFPEHLLTFTERLTGPSALRAGVSAKLLQVIRGSQQSVSHGELVELLLVTVGGAAIDEDTPTVQRTERVLSQLVGEAMTSREGILSLEHAAPETRPVPQIKLAESTLPASPDAAAPAASELDGGAASSVTLSPEVRSVAGVEFAPGPMTAFDAGEPEIAILAERASPRAIAWPSPPGFVWAALVCGVLLPPCMYLLSRPHAAGQRTSAAVSAAATHTGARPRAKSDLVFPALVQWKPLDLDFLEELAPKKRSHARVSHTRPTSVAAQTSAEGVLSVVRTGSEVQAPKR